MKEVRTNLIKEKSFDFALRIVKLYKYLCNEKKEMILSKQLLRSGTSIGAMQRESEHAESTADLFTNYLLHKRNQMKPYIGWNFFIKQNTLMKKLL